MNLAIRLAIVVSLSLNFCLGILYVRELRSGPLQPVASEPSEPTVTAAATSAADIGAISAYYRKLQGVAISEAERRALVLVQLKAVHFPPPTGVPRYWEMAKPAQAPRAAAQVRESLLALFGAAAWEEAVFVEFFRPLQPQLPFLGATKQVALEQIFIASREAALKQAGTDVDWAEQRRLADQAAQSLEGSVRKLLNAKEYAEYELRMSRLAQSLRMMRLNLSEAQYRTLYGAVNQNPMLQAAVTRTLAELKPSEALYDHKVADILGPQYVRFMTQCDPLYSMLASLTRNQNIAPQAAKVAYADLVDAQTSIAKLRANADPSLPAAIEARHQKLTAALGAPAAMMVEGMLGGGVQPGSGVVRTSLMGAR